MMSCNSGFCQQHRKLTAEFAVFLGEKKQAFSAKWEGVVLAFVQSIN